MDPKFDLTRTRTRTWTRIRTRTRALTIDTFQTQRLLDNACHDASYTRDTSEEP